MYKRRNVVSSLKEIVFILVVALAAVGAQSAEVERILVFPLEAIQIEPAIAKELAQGLASELEGNGYIVGDVSAVEKLLEQRLESTTSNGKGAASPSVSRRDVICRELAAELGADAYVTGTVLEVDGRVRIEAARYDTSGTIRALERTEVDAGAELQPVVVGIVAALIDAPTPEPAQATPAVEVPPPDETADPKEPLEAEVEVETGSEAQADPGPPAEQEALTYRERLEEEWTRVKAYAKDESAPAEDRLVELERFVEEFPEDNRHLLYAEKLISQLKAGRSVSGSHRLELNRNFHKEWTDNETIHLRFGFGIRGFRMTIELFRLRWEHFHLALASGDFSAGWGGFGGAGGLTLGVPFKLDPEGMKELRLGLAIRTGLRYLRAYVGDDPLSSHYDSLIPDLIPEIVYLKRRENSKVAFSLAVELYVFTVIAGKVLPDIAVLAGFVL
jgi:hypothetical protein